MNLALTGFLLNPFCYLIAILSFETLPTALRLYFFSAKDAIVKVFKKDSSGDSKEDSKAACSKQSKCLNPESAGSLNSSGHAVDSIKPK